MQLRPVDPNVSFPDLEESRLDLWDEQRIFERSVSERDAEKAYVFYDGPPFATGLPHYGHLVASILKDIMPRYWTMRGCRVERRWGWDCHGLPVENETEKANDLKEKRDIEKFGIGEFNEACRSIVLRYTQEWRKTIRRIGRWVDFDNDYKTMDRSFMESVWWAFNQLWEKRLIYQGFRVQPFCPRCGTPLSNFELNQPGGYKDRQDPSVTLRMPLLERDDAELWIWTTTPWTLPSNAAVAVGPDIDYVEVEQEEGRNVILAEARVSAYFPDIDESRIVERFKGLDLIGQGYEPLFRFQDDVDALYQVLPGDFVSTEDGTGLVHMAPAYGEDDFELCSRHKLPTFEAVGRDGRFTALVPKYKGKSVKDADKDILRDLKKKGAIVRHDTLVHSYPHCYRCETPLLYMALQTWFMEIGADLKASMLAANEQSTWVPGTIKNGRFGKWLEGARDWNLSRNRYWGTPIPVWICDQCDRRECLGSAAELERHAGAEIPDLHKHFVDAIEWDCECGGRMKRIPEIFDCWFESGSMPYAQNHYPFENEAEFGHRFPADFIAEGVDQTRAWFYTLTVLGAALFDGPAYRNVIVNGIVLAEDGEKMSKSKRNYPDPRHVLDRFGADALRIYLINSPVVNAREIKFNERGVEEHVRSVLLPLWNAYSFLTRYASVDGWEPDGTAPDPRVNELDGWILAYLQVLVSTVRSNMDSYELYRVVPALVDFIERLTNWYIRRSRRRFWRATAAGGSDGDKLNAYRTLHHVLLEASKVLAPFLPFISDEIYGNLSCGKGLDSVHLEGFPEVDDSLINADLVWRMDVARTTVALGRALRSKHNVKIRQPLSTMTVVAKSPEVERAYEATKALILEELNVKELLVTGDESELVTYSVLPKLKVLGPQYGKQLQAIRQELGQLTSDDLAGLLEGDGVYDGGIESKTVPGLFYNLNTVLVDRTSREDTVVETSDSVTVALDLTVTAELRREGLAREVINRIQNQRKEMGLELDNRIDVRIEASGGLADAIRDHWTLIAAEVLAEGEVPELSAALERGVAHRVEGEQLVIGIRKRG